MSDTCKNMNDIFQHYAGFSEHRGNLNALAGFVVGFVGTALIRPDVSLGDIQLALHRAGETCPEVAVLLRDMLDNIEDIRLDSTMDCRRRLADLFLSDEYLGGMIGRINNNEKEA